MQISTMPVKIPVQWASGASTSYVRQPPVSSQIGITAGAASFTDGFVPLNFQPIASGGVPPFGQDTNGILNMLSGWARWQNAGAPLFYDSDFSTAVGGYPKGSVLASSANNGVYWRSTADNNATDPDGGSPANWEPMVTTGSLKDLAVTTGKLADGAATNAKLSSVSTSTIKGRVAAGSGLVQDLAPSDIYSILATSRAGLNNFLGRTGTLAHVAHSTSDNDIWLIADGRTVSRTTYASLFSAIGTQWGPGDGSTTFNIPDARGYNLVGADLGRGLQDGLAVAVSHLDQMQGHIHTLPSLGENTASNNLLSAGSHGGTFTAPDTGSPKTDGTNGTPRTGLTTHGREVAVTIVIYY